MMKWQILLLIALCTFEFVGAQAQVRTIHTGETVNEYVCGDCAHIWQFTADSEQVVMISLNVRSNTLEPNIELFVGQDDLLAENSGYGDYFANIGPLSIPISGTYLIEVTSRDTTAGRYELSLMVLDAPAYPTDITALEDIDTLLNEARAQHSIGENHDALEILDNILLRDEENVQALNWRSRALIELGDLSAASMDIRKLIRIAPDSSNTFEVLARYWHAVGDTDRAMSFLVRAIDRDANNAQTHLTIGQIYFDNLQFVQAIESLTKSIQLEMTYEAIRLRGEAYLALSLMPNAVADFTQLIVLQPNQPAPYLYWAHLYSETNLIDAATAATDIALSIEPEHVATHIQVSDLERISNPSGSITMLENLLERELSPLDQSTTLTRIGTILSEDLDDTVSAMDYYTSATALNVAYPTPHFRLGQLFLESNRYSEAIDSITAAIAISPTTHHYYYYRGLAYKLSENDLDALYDFERAKRLEPRWLLPRVEIAKLYEQNQQFLEARFTYEQIITIADSTGNSSDPIVAEADTALENLEDLVCTATSAVTVNTRYEPSVSSSQVNTIDPDRSASIQAQAIGDDGLVWYWLMDRSWVRSDVVVLRGDCSNVTSTEANTYNDLVLEGTNSRTGAEDCTLTANTNANLRSGPGIEHPILDVLSIGSVTAVRDSRIGADQFIWWQTMDGGWVREDTVSANAECKNLSE